MTTDPTPTTPSRDSAPVLRLPLHTRGREIRDADGVTVALGSVRWGNDFGDADAAFEITRICNAHPDLTAKVAALEGELAQAIKRRDAARKREVEWCALWEAALSRAEASAGLREALERYGVHEPTCPVWQDNAAGCACGLSAIITKANKETT